MAMHAAVLEHGRPPVLAAEHGQPAAEQAHAQRHAPAEVAAAAECIPVPQQWITACRHQK
jgi:hypothetical protein